VDESVREWVELVIGGRVVSSETLPAGTSTVVAARCQTAEGSRDVVAKVYELGHWFATRQVVEFEAAAIRGAAAAVPTPEIIATTWDSPHASGVKGNGLLMECLAGASRLREADVVADLPATAEALAAIHELAPPDAPGTWPAPPRKFTEHLTVPAWTRLPEEWAGALEAARAERPGSAPVFLHGDFYPGNLLFDPDGTLTGVVDWSAASVGPPEYDVAELRASVSLLAGVGAADRLLSTYQEITRRNLPNQAWFDLRAALSLFCPEPSDKWEWRDPRLNAELLRPRLESYVLDRYRAAIA
jgi:Ser/Thr protein kinase RdoA (MazF antagonist)